MPTPANDPLPEADRLAGRTVVVTGAARGVGRAIAQECARQGARLVLCDLLEERGRETAAALSQLGAQVRFAPVDLADPDSIKAFAASVAQEEGSIPGLSRLDDETRVEASLFPLDGAFRQNFFVRESTVSGDAERPARPS